MPGLQPPTAWARLTSPRPLTAHTALPSVQPPRAGETGLQHEVVKLSEELDLVRLQLDAARQDAENARRRAATIENSMVGVECGRGAGRRQWACTELGRAVPGRLD